MPEADRGIVASHMPLGRMLARITPNAAPRASRSGPGVLVAAPLRLTLEARRPLGRWGSVPCAPRVCLVFSSEPCEDETCKLIYNAVLPRIVCKPGEVRPELKVLD